MRPRLRFIDIAVNLTDCVFFGIDRKGKKIHEPDIDLVVQRAQQQGVERMIITGTSLDVSSRAIELCRKFPGTLFCTVGIHPAHSDEFLDPATREAIARAIPPQKSSNNKRSNQAPAGTQKAMSSSVSATAAAAASTAAALTATETTPANTSDLVKLDATFSASVVKQLRDLIIANRDVVVAVGECGLDYAELSPAVTPALQAAGFNLQAQLAAELKMPLLLHSRDCDMDFAKLMVDFCQKEQSEKKTSPVPGVVHSFNGSDAELTTLLSMGIKVSVNASAFRDEAIAKSVASKIPVADLMLETDAPWVDPRPNDWGFDVANAFIESALPAFLPKEKFEMGKCVQRRNEPATLPAVFAEYCKARRMFLAGSNEDGNDDAAAAGWAQQMYRNALEIFFPAEFKRLLWEQQQEQDEQAK